MVALKILDLCYGEQVATRVIVMQHKTQRPVQFEITSFTRETLNAWIKQAARKSEDYLFPSRLHESPQMGTWHYGRILRHLVDGLGLGRADYGTHSMRRTKTTPIYRPRSSHATERTKADIGTRASKDGNADRMPEQAGMPFW